MGDRQLVELRRIEFGGTVDTKSGPDEVVLKMLAASLNFRDQLVVHRGYGRITGELPLVPISDGVGEIVAVGEEVRRRKVGERVCVCFNQLHVDGELTDGMMAGLLGGPLDGTASEYMSAEETGVVLAPEHLDDLEAATLGCAAITRTGGTGKQIGNTVLFG